MATIRPFTNELRKQGFQLDYRDRSGGTTVTEFKMRKGDREVRVQFWADGKHRASHGTYRTLKNGVEGYRETTMPTNFRTVPEMLKAVEREWTRPSTETHR